MDLMDIRRMLITMVGGTSGMIGEFSKYEKVTKAGETNEAKLLVTHTLGVVPKLVIVSCSDTDVPYTTENYIRTAVFIPSCGGSNSVSSVSHAEIAQSFLPAETLTNSKFNMSSTEVNIYQGSTVAKWSKNTNYTVELYA